MIDVPVAFDAETGLAPAVVQDASSGRVLMLGYVNAESLELTRRTGFVHFWSRSRRELWRKGATSGNTLRVVDMFVDCDADAVLIAAEAAGPTCHEGSTSCFDRERTEASSLPAMPRTALWTTIRERARTRPPGSYTSELLERGVDGIGRKIVEEATEVLLAARDHAGGGPAARVYEEIADLEYHVLVLLAERGLDPAGVAAVLAARADAGRAPGTR